MLDPSQKKYKPIIAKLSDGTSGINERPAKIFSKTIEESCPNGCHAGENSRTSKKKKGTDIANKMTA